MTDHPITPPPELVKQWLGTYFSTTITGEVSDIELTLATQAARWGADQELEACCELLHKQLGEDMWEIPVCLRLTRRPKLPSLKEQALAVLENEPEADHMKDLVVFDVDQVELIRRALEALDD